MIDKNNNQIPDKVEAIITYIIASICLVIAIVGWVQETIDEQTFRWLIGFSVFLSGERDVGKFIWR